MAGACLILALPARAETSAVEGVVTTADAFAPPRLTIDVGTVVRWTVDDLGAHDVTAADGSWASARLLPGMTFEHRFDEPGAYPYYCTLHGQCTEEGCTGQTGTVVVAAPAPPTHAAEPAEQPTPEESRGETASEHAQGPQPQPDAAVPAPPPPPAAGSTRPGPIVQEPPVRLPPRFVPRPRTGLWATTLPAPDGSGVLAPVVAPPREEAPTTQPQPEPYRWRYTLAVSAASTAVDPTDSGVARIAMWLVVAFVLTLAALQATSRHLAGFDLLADPATVGVSDRA